jgi:hypothetical protein
MKGSRGDRGSAILFGEMGPDGDEGLPGDIGKFFMVFFNITSSIYCFN